MELFVDDLVECHGDVRVRAMTVLCHLRGFASEDGSSIYCDTLSVSQYDSKVRSSLHEWQPDSHESVRRRATSLQLLNNLFSH